MIDIKEYLKEYKKRTNFKKKRIELLKELFLIKKISLKNTIFQFKEWFEKLDKRYK